MYAVRAWSVRHARGLNAFYRSFEGLLVRLHPLFRAVGYLTGTRTFEFPVGYSKRLHERLTKELEGSEKDSKKE